MVAPAAGTVHAQRANPGRYDTHTASRDSTCAAGELRGRYDTHTASWGQYIDNIKKAPRKGLNLFLLNLFHESGDSRYKGGKSEDDLREVLDKFGAHR